MFGKVTPTAGMIAILASTVAAQNNGSIIVQSTTSTANSGLYDFLIPIFQDRTGIRVDVVAVGTGQAIINAQNCDGDVLLVHSKTAEDAFVTAGFGTKRIDLMYNDFVLVGPENDPARVNNLPDVQDAFAKIADAQALFVSRGDASGTHTAELTLWEETGIDPTVFSGEWYRETGSGMGAALNTAIGMGAYTMVDRATWVRFENKQDFTIMIEGDSDLFNQYGVIPVNSDRCPNVDADAAEVFVNWLLSQDGQEAIASYIIDDQQLYFPNAPSR
jgi:tungstate transport system substrate-binding protein